MDKDASIDFLHKKNYTNLITVADTARQKYWGDIFF